MISADFVAVLRVTRIDRGLVEIGVFGVLGVFRWGGITADVGKE